MIFLGPKGGCASSRLDHGLKVELDPYIKGTKRQFFLHCFTIFWKIFQVFRAVNLNFPSFFAGARAWARVTGPGPGPGPAKKDGKCFFLFSTGFSSRMGPQKANIHRFLKYFPACFPNIWPLAGPNIAKKDGPLRKLARGDRQSHFGTFNFWVKPGFY